MTNINKEEIAYESAKILLDTKSVLCNSKEPFTFTSGKLSPVYTDCRRLISFPEQRSRLMDYAVELLSAEVGLDNMDFLAGGETAGIPFAAFIADRMKKPMLYVRKKPKGFGRLAQIEGCMDDEGKNVILIEDLQTDGGSKELFINVLREAGAVVDHAFVVFHYGIFAASEENMKKAGVNLHALTTWWDVLKVAKELSYFDDETLVEVEAFLNDPIGWQEKAAARA